MTLKKLLVVKYIKFSSEISNYINGWEIVNVRLVDNLKDLGYVCMDLGYVCMDLGYVCMDLGYVCMDLGKISILQKRNGLLQSVRLFHTALSRFWTIS